MKLTFYENNEIDKSIEIDINELIKRYEEYLKNRFDLFQRANFTHLLFFFSEIGSFTFEVEKVENYFYKTYLKMTKEQ